MASSDDYVRNYKQEAKTAKKRKETGFPTSGNTKRKSARYALEKAGKVGKGQDVDHKKPLSKGGTNARSNLRVVSAGKNRSFARNPDGSIKSKKKR